MVDMKLEVVVLPVSDVDRAKRFYSALGWREDADFAGPNDFRVVRLTPPGSPCSVHFGTGVTDAAPGSARNLYLVVDDLEAARAELVAGGADVSEVFHRTPTDPGGSGPDPERRSYASFAAFSDPDGNSWLVQEIRTRLPGREWADADADTDAAALAELLRDAEEHHGRYEPTAPKHHWSDWYAGYIVARRQGRSQDEAYADASAALAARA